MICCALMISGLGINVSMLSAARVIILTYAAAINFPIKKKGFPCLQAPVIIFPFPAPTLEKYHSALGALFGTWEIVSPYLLPPPERNNFLEYVSWKQSEKATRFFSFYFSCCK